MGFCASLFIVLILNMLEGYLNHWTLFLSFLLNNDVNFKPVNCFIGLISLIVACKMQQKQNILRVRRHNENIGILPVFYHLTESTVAGHGWKASKDGSFTVSCCVCEVAAFTTSLLLNDWEIFIHILRQTSHGLHLAPHNCKHTCKFGY